MNDNKPKMLPRNTIRVRGAKENNLKNISLKIPHNKFVVITGVSGYGKTSLAFDTLYAEGQRRYVESLSSYARLFLGRMKKPKCDSITQLPPAIAIEQKVVSRNGSHCKSKSQEGKCFVFSIEFLYLGDYLVSEGKLHFQATGIHIGNIPSCSGYLLQYKENYHTII